MVCALLLKSTPPSHAYLDASSSGRIFAEDIDEARIPATQPRIKDSPSNFSSGATTMSLTALSTELDTMIANHLSDGKSRKALCALSRVSRYYHHVAEPVLYRDIGFCDKAEIRAKRLMVTLLDRPELARHISRITLLAQDTKEYTEPCYTCTSSVSEHTELSHTTHMLQQYISSVTKTIDSLGLKSDRLAKVWLADVFKRTDDVDPEDPSLDGVLALIFALAPNVQEAHLGTIAPGSLDITLQVISLHDWDHYRQSPICPKLAELDVYGFEARGDTFSFGLPSAVQKLSMWACDVLNIRMISTPQMALRKLELLNVHITPSAFESLFSHPCASRLEYLSLDHICDVLQPGQATPVISNLLRKHLPCLKTFRCVRPDDDSTPTNCILDSLYALQELHTLHIDFTLLSRYLRQMTQDSRVSFLPPSLRHLEVTDAMTVPLEDLRLRSEERGPLDSPSRSSLWQLIVSPATVLTLESFNLVVTPTSGWVSEGEPASLRDLRSEMIERLHDAVVAASQRGIKFCVYGDSRGWELKRQLLMSVDTPFAAPVSTNEASESSNEGHGS